MMNLLLAACTGARKQDLLRVVFKSMPALERERLCAQNPRSHWHGEVRLDADGPYLYLTDVLGAELR